jgi:hypothetical protein
MLTSQAGAATTDEIHFVVTAGKHDGVIGSVHTPVSPALRSLTGTSLRHGFRKVIAAGHYAESGSLVAQLLDDLPVVVMVAGYSTAVEGAPVREQPNPDRIGVCMGWRPGGTVDLALMKSGTIPIRTGPPAPALDAFDPSGWHSLPELERHAVRRLRQLDLTRTNGAFHVEAMFRDSHMDSDGHETVIHEYDLAAQIDMSTQEILAIESTPRVLPYRECPKAADSTRRVAGMSVSNVRRAVPTTLSGVSSCTHLNDLIRTLGDVPLLGRQIPDAL